MSSIKSQLSELMKSSMKSGDKDLLAFVRNLHAVVRKKEIDDRVDLDDAGIQKLITSLAKQRQDSIEQFRAGNRADLVAREEAELKFLMGFMPTQLSESEVRSLVDRAIATAKASGPKDMGAVMKVLMPDVQGKADGKLVSQIVKERLAPGA